jgi:hypothetical protein
MLLIRIFLLLLRLVCSVPASSPQNIKEVAALYKLDQVLDAVPTAARKKDLAKALLAARNRASAKFSSTADSELEFVRRSAALCDVDLTPDNTLVCRQNADFTHRNWAIDMLLEDCCTGKSATAPPPTSTPNERSLVLQELKASKQGQLLQTKAVRVWELYTKRYRHSKAIRFRTYKKLELNTPVSSFSLPVLSSVADLREQLGSAVDQVFVRTDRGKFESIDLIRNSTVLLLELGLHPSSNLYLA